MKYLYTAVLEPFDDGSGYHVTIPDLPHCVTSGKDLADAIDMATDAASAWICSAEDHDIPIKEPTPQDELEINSDALRTMIQIDTIKYRALTDTRSVRKNVSLPAWLATLAEREGVNCSQVLQEALRTRFGISSI